MTPQQFWDEDVCLAEQYREAQKIRDRMENNNEWRQGLYFFNALSVAIGNALRKEGTDPDNYMENPLPLTRAEAEEQRKAAEEDAYQKHIDEMRAWAARYSAEKE